MLEHVSLAEFGAHLLRMRFLLPPRDGWSRGDLARLRHRSVEALRRYAYTHSPFYRRFHSGLLDRPLHELPVMTKSLLMDHFDDVVTDRSVKLADVEAHLAALRGNELFLNRYWVNGTSGSTGKRGVFLFNPREWATVIAGFGRANLWAGFEMGVLRRKRVATVASRVPWHLSFRALATFDPFQPNVLSLDAGKPVESLVDALNEWRPRMLAGYPSSLRALAKEQLAGRLRIHPEVVFSGGEVLSRDARSVVRAAWGREVFDVYGSTEAGSVAAECECHRGLHVLEDLVVVEVVDEKNRPVGPGSYGDKALVTVLFNRTQPLIRYELSDRLRFASSGCPCGRPYPLIESIEGRAEEMLEFPAASGERVALHPLAFEQILDAVPAAEWQVVHEPGRLLVLLAGAREGYRDETVAQSLRDALTVRGAVVPIIDVMRVSSIPRGATGKAAIVKKVADPSGSKDSKHPPGWSAMDTL